MAAPAFDALAGGDMARPADDQRHAERVVVDGVVVEEAVVVIEGFAVVGGDDDDRVVVESERGQRGEDVLDAGVHVADGAVVLGDDVVLVRQQFAVGAGGHPVHEVVAERLEGEDGIHGVVVRIVFVAFVEEAVERTRREVRRMGIHVAEEEEPRLVFGGEAAEFGQAGVVQIFSLVGLSVFAGVPVGEIQIGLETTCGGVATETDTGRVVAFVIEDFSERLAADGALVAESDGVVAKAVQAGEHGGVAGRRRNVGREVVFKEGAAFRELVHVGGGVAEVAVAAHVLGKQGVDADEKQIWFAHVCAFWWIFDCN